MSTIAPAQPTTSAVHLALADLYRINVHEYERIVAAGALDDERLELIDGYMVKKMPKNPPHSWSTRKVLDLMDGSPAAGMVMAAGAAGADSRLRRAGARHRDRPGKRR